ncbi:MAG: 26S protease regulatory subunit [Deltaproteobacteria bacterium]|nr:26S protease regulatory subunit [Deltaproteobacteria bacterium]MBW2445368.1 26S protease regulatory subunit [Deltaproteobacteria bacterium]
MGTIDPIQAERAGNLWTSFSRKFAPVAKATRLSTPELTFDQVGGLASPKDELLTFACAATSPDVYGRWGTFPPSGLLLIGGRGTGKKLLAEALASQTETGFLLVQVPRLVMETLRHGGKVGELVEEWSQTLEELPPTTVFFDELEFYQAHELGSQRDDLPVGPVMDFLLDLVDRTVAAQDILTLGSTSYPDTLRPAFLSHQRFERVVEVTPIFPGDIVAALEIHAASASQRAGRPLFEDVDWNEAVRPYGEHTAAEWTRILHGVLRRKARCEAAGEPTAPITTADLLEEASRVQGTKRRLSYGQGNYI